MTTFAPTIDRNVPVPAVRTGRKPVYRWADMGPGDSFMIPDVPGKQPARLAFAAGRRAHPGSTWESHRVVEEGVTGTRVWRMM